MHYQTALQDIPAPGAGCHRALLSVANHGAIAGLTADQIFSDIRQAIPSGGRRVSDGEISDAVNKALSDRAGDPPRPSPRPIPVVKDGKAALMKIIEQGKFSTEAELTETSPVKIPTDPRDQQRLFLQTVFDPGGFIFCGDRLQPGTAETIQPACHWAEVGAPGPFIIINPFSGFPAPLKSGIGTTYRGDGCVKAHRHCLVEFDNLTLDEQIRFWSAIKLPVKALIHTGGKSIHGWLDLSDQHITAEQWQKTIKNELYDKRLAPLGVDMACSNPARLSRLPGVFRAEKNQWQRLLWLSKEGQNV
ncbi:MAG: hypothetical protein ACYDH8_14415 [Syntrophales bacterium]